MDTVKSLVYISLCSAAVYLFVVLAIRVFGKKDLAQLSVVDVVFILLISNAVQNAMVGPDTSLLGGLTAATTLFVINTLFKRIVRKFPRFNTFLQGHAIMLAYQGKINMDNMEKAGITMAELNEACREHGIQSVEDANLVVLEVDGNISIISNDFQTKTKNKHRRSKLEKPLG